MPARTGDEYIAGLRENPPELYLQGERVTDPTTHPGFATGCIPWRGCTIGSTTPTCGTR